MTVAAAVLAVALLVGADVSRIKRRALVGNPASLDVPIDNRASTSQPADALATATTFDVLATCLRAGMAVSTAASATAPSAPPRLAQILRRAADLLALGADSSTAWSAGSEPDDRHTEALLRLARRSATSGAAMAQGLSELADRSRGDAADLASAAAERGSVLIAGPLGLCYLPAFVCLGIVPVIAGLAHDVLRSGIL
jgi:pilus assembly protein TadC